MPDDLRNLFLAHTGKLSDKWALYLDVWDEVLSPYRDREIDLLEIGIHNGGSLEIWAQYFPSARHIIGCDVNPDCEKLNYEDPRIKVIIGDANSQEVENAVRDSTPGLDIIIDDGSHQSGDVICAFTRYFRHLNPNGLYLIEDLHTSYWTPFGGGLFAPYSAIAFFKRLVDITNFEHWRGQQSRQEFLLPYKERYGAVFNEFDLCQIHSVKFINSLCIIRKRPPQENKLGNRMVVGLEEGVSKGERNLNGISIHDIAVPNNDDPQLDIFTLISQKKALETNVDQLRQVIAAAEADAAELEKIKGQQQLEMAERDRIIQGQQGDLSERDQIIKQAKKDLADREQRVQELQTEVTKQALMIDHLSKDLEKEKQSVQQLSADVVERDQSIQALKLEVARQKEAVLFYALSKSWRLTRPLRKLTKFLKGKRNA